MYLLIHQLYLLHQKCFLNIGQLKQNREMVLWGRCKLQAVIFNSWGQIVYVDQNNLLIG